MAKSLQLLRGGCLVVAAQHRSVATLNVLFFFFIFLMLFRRRASAPPASLPDAAGAPPIALAASLRPDGVAGVALALHVAALRAGFAPPRPLPPSPCPWPGSRTATEWVWTYDLPGAANTFQLHVSLQAASGRLLVQLRELAGGDAPAVAAHAYMGVQAPRYVGPAPLGDEWGDAVVRTDGLEAMAQQLLFDPVKAAAVKKTGGERRLPGGVAAAVALAAAAVVTVAAGRRRG